MSERARISIGLVVTLALLAGFAWANRVELMLSVIGFAMDQKYATRPNVPVEWESGGVAGGTVPTPRMRPL